MKNKPDKTHPTTISGLTDCHQTAQLLTQTIRSEHGKACGQSPVVSMVLYELLVDVCEIERRLGQLLVVAKE